MKLITLKNTSESNVVQFPIAEPELVNDEVRYDLNGNIKTTGATLLWSIDAGQTKAFPEYVAKELLKVYQFLKVETEDKAEETEEVKQVDPLNCQYCGQQFTNMKGKALHFAAKHQDKL